jgi:hypothetical protein
VTSQLVGIIADPAGTHQVLMKRLYGNASSVTQGEVAGIHPEHRPHPAPAASPTPLLSNASLHFASRKAHGGTDFLRLAPAQVFIPPANFHASYPQSLTR